MKEYHERKRTGDKCERVILYVHGGAYYFGSVDEHRYQMQRHARKLRARVLSPRYRLAPQFPFPCGLYDCLATYYYLLEHFDPTQIIFAGDSAGGGMVLSMLVVLRDQGQPLPAGTILISPWVDLTHSFPSVAGDGAGDYIPAHGFHHRPSMAWPPPSDSGTRSYKSALVRSALVCPLLSCALCSRTRSHLVRALISYALCSRVPSALVCPLLSCAVCSCALCSRVPSTLVCPLLSCAVCHTIRSSIPRSSRVTLKLTIVSFRVKALKTLSMPGQTSSSSHPSRLRAFLCVRVDWWVFGVVRAVH